ncbi:hypothetical protein [Stutzerimonas stutzeri]|uniref:hypothetical protein n=1 Tax=Stutzerimonas stutzeri TaxID=316 RepID=UPI001C2EB5BE|nr:hypothetical protein [Stutzerimonas stutzeri]
MRQGSLFLMLVLSLALASAQANEESIAPPLEQQDELKQPLLEEEAQRDAPSGRLETAVTDAERAQLSHLRQENHRLRMQLQQGQPKVQPPLLNDQQQWFAVGGGVGVLGFLLGVLTTRGRRRRQWLN